MSKDSNLGLFGLLGEFAQGARTIGRAIKATRSSSLSEYLGSTSVEPTCLVEGSLQHTEIMESLAMNLLETYSCMYIQVATRLNLTEIDAVRVTRTLEKLATDRDVLDAVVATESEGKDFISLGLENDTKDRFGKGALRTDSKQYAVITENNNLSVGKLIKLEVSKGNERIDIPVAIRFRTRVCDSKLIMDIFEANYADLNLINRIKLYQREEITLGEALSGSDIIARQERVRAADKDHLVRSHFTNALKDAGYTALTGEIPLNRASGVTVITSATEALINRKIGGKIEKFKDRERFFAGTATMILAVVNQEDEVVDIYYRGFKDGSTETFRSIARSSGKSNNDLTPLVKDLLNGRVG